LSFLFIIFSWFVFRSGLFLCFTPMEHSGHPLQNTLHMLFKSFSA